MAVELCSSASPDGSPRLSFSRDSPPPQLDEQQQRPLDTSDPPSPDFHFCVPDCTQASLNPTPADELFFNGNLKPLPQNAFFPSPVLLPPVPHKERIREVIASPDDDAAGERVANPAKPGSFWRFSRSASVNFGGGGNKPGGLMCSLPLLLRSKSASSDSSPVAPKQQRRSGSNTATNPKNLRKSSSTPKAWPFPTQQHAPSSYYYGSSKNGGTGVPISPVLHVPAAFNVKGGGSGFLGFGYLFCSGREKGRSYAKKKSLSVS